jgi:hypothetical protein
MKIKRKIQKRSLIKLYLLKYQTYKNYNNKLSSFCVEDLSVKLKQALKIIYLYATKKKKILFIGFPYNKSVYNQLNHFFVPKKIFLRHGFAAKMFLNKTPDLVVVNVMSKKDLIILKDIKSKGLPLVTLQSLNNSDLGSNQKFHSEVKSFCFFLIFSILTKVNKLF